MDIRGRSSQFEDYVSSDDGFISSVERCEEVDCDQVYTNLISTTEEPELR